MSVQCVWTLYRRRILSGARTKFVVVASLRLATHKVEPGAALYRYVHVSRNLILFCSL